VLARCFFNAGKTKTRFFNGATRDVGLFGLNIKGNRTPRRCVIQILVLFCWLWESLSFWRFDRKPKSARKTEGNEIVGTVVEEKKRAGKNKEKRGNSQRLSNDQTFFKVLVVGCDGGVMWCVASVFDRYK